nr:MAG TPA: hypothetical protein [Caudoviricetes sp.]
MIQTTKRSRDDNHMMSRLAMNRWIVPRDINPATYDPNN